MDHLRSSHEDCNFSGWLDLNRNGSCDEPGEQVLGDASLAASAEAGRRFELPATSLTGSTCARSRCSSEADLYVGGGQAADGHVEGYQVRIEPLVSRIHLPSCCGSLLDIRSSRCPPANHAVGLQIRRSEPRRFSLY